MSQPTSKARARSGGPGPRRRRRRKVVILVDNEVRRDSRVQKQALSMSEFGWKVRVLGRAPGDRVARWRIGSARVRLLEVPIHRRPHENRDTRWRDPFSYGSEEQQAQRLRAFEHRDADVTHRVAEARLTGTTRGPIARRLANARLLPARAANHVQARWVGFRRGRTEAVHRKRREMAAPVDRLTTWWWTVLRGRRAWRRLDPHLWDFEAAYGPVIDAIDPDLIHANDFRMLGVGARAKMRAAARGKNVRLVWDAHEFLPGTQPWDNHPRWHVAQLAHEREFAAYADEVVTVSEELGDLLVAQHHLKRRPNVVLNCPLNSTGEPRPPGSPGVRDLCGVTADTPILVYSGTPARQRGLSTVVEALPQLGDAVLALVVWVPGAAPVQEIVAQARELGVEHRVHLLPYVAPEHVVEYLSSADIGLIPIQHFPNHEIALITKFFEYSHARLPIVVSDVRAMAAEVRRTGQGEVFKTDDVDGFADAVRRVLADPKKYRQAYDDEEQLEQWTWERQALILDEVYRRALRSPRRLK